MKIAREEYDRFWDQAFGKDWYIEEGEDDGESLLVEIGDMCAVWQGDGDPKPRGVLTARDLTDDVAIGVSKMYKRWKKAQTTTTVVASFDAPNDATEALLAQIKALGGKVLK
jgi:hypothetical protein